MAKNRSIHRSIVPTFLGFMLLAGCVSPPSEIPFPSSSTKPTTVPSPAPVPVPAPLPLTPTPTPTPSSPANPAALECRSLVTPAAWNELTSNGFQWHPDFEKKVRAEGGDLVRLLDLGGIACQWGYPRSDSTVVLGFAYVTPQQATQERKHLSSNGWIPSTRADGTERWALANTEDMLGNVPGYEFREGNVRFALHADGSFAYFAV